MLLYIILYVYFLYIYNINYDQLWFFFFYMPWFCEQSCCNCVNFRWGAVGFRWGAQVKFTWTPCVMLDSGVSLYIRWVKMARFQNTAVLGQGMNSIASWREGERSLTITVAMQLNSASPWASQAKKFLSETVEKSFSTVQVRRLEPSMKWNAILAPS